MTEPTMTDKEVGKVQMNQPFCRVCQKIVKVIRPTNTSDARVWCAEHDPECQETSSVIVWRMPLTKPTKDEHDEKVEALLPCNPGCKAWPDGIEHSVDCPARRRPVVAAELREQAREHCKDCCCAQSWKALGVKVFTGLSIPEHIKQQAERIKALEEALKEIEDDCKEVADSPVVNKAEARTWRSVANEARAALEGK